MKDEKYSFEIKKSVLDCYVMSVSLYGNKGWTISSNDNKKLETNNTCDYYNEVWQYPRQNF